MLKIIREVRTLRRYMCDALNGRIEEGLSSYTRFGSTIPLSQALLSSRGKLVDVYSRTFSDSHAWGKMTFQVSLFSSNVSYRRGISGGRVEGRSLGLTAACDKLASTKHRIRMSFCSGDSWLYHYFQNLWVGRLFGDAVARQTNAKSLVRSAAFVQSMLRADGKDYQQFALLNHAQGLATQGDEFQSLRQLAHQRCPFSSDGVDPAQAETSRGSSKSRRSRR